MTTVVNVAVAAPVIVEVRLEAFRCFRTAVLEPGPQFNLIAGGNASGKTSLLEALFFLGRGSSFRAARVESAIHFETERCTLFGRLGAGPASRVGIELLRGDGLQVRVDGEVGTRADLARAIPVQILDPASHELVSGPPAGRRQFLDWGVFHVEQRFLGAWQRYRRALQQRNAALRLRNESTAWVWDEILATDGEVVDDCRRQALARLGPIVKRVGAELLDAEVELHYQAGWTEGTTLEKALAASRERDLQMASSTVGPHRADLRIAVRCRRAKDTVSRGQEKLVAAALTLAQVELVAAALSRTVVLLLDEPGADLDRTHVGRLLAAVARAPVQSFVTSLDPGGLTLPNSARAFHVEHAKVRALL